MGKQTQIRMWKNGRGVFLAEFIGYNGLRMSAEMVAIDHLGAMQEAAARCATYWKTVNKKVGYDARPDAIENRDITLEEYEQIWEHCLEHGKNQRLRENKSKGCPRGQVR